MRTAVVVNPVAGKLGGRAGAVRRHVDRAVGVLGRGGAQVRVHLTERAGHAAELARLAVADGASMVVAWGGDGTLNEVAGALAGTPVPMAVLPAGSGSGLARALGIPLRWQDALETALAGAERVIDVGRLNGRVFVNVAGIGFDAHVARAFNAERRGRRGLLSYVRLVVRELRRFRPQPCVVRLGEEAIAAEPLLIALANSPQYGNGARIAPLARLDDGKIDVVVVRATTPLRDLWRARRLFDGTMARDPLTVLCLATRLTIEADRPILFHVDGEPFEDEPPLHVEVQPASLRVRVPASGVGAIAG
jgi:YegS/Rv2252/BmrU family lipid kinase